MDYEEIHCGAFTVLVGPFVPGALSEPVFGRQQFDCFIVDLGAQLEGATIRDIASEIARGATDWVETFGANAEAFHDAVDRASVEIGRQQHIGDGVPTTAWHEDLHSVDEIVDYIMLGGHGSRVTKVVMVVGTKDDATRLANAIREQRPSE